MLRRLVVWLFFTYRFSPPITDNDDARLHSQFLAVVRCFKGLS